MSEKTKQRFAKINTWLVAQSGDFFTNMMRDVKSLKALWNYLMLGLFTWVIVYCVRFHAETCGNTAIMTVGTVVTAIFTNYVWAAHAEKKAAATFPAYTNPDGATPGITPATPDADGGDGNG